MRRKFITTILLTFVLSTLIACGKTEGSQAEYSQSGQGIYDLPSQKEIDEAFYMVEEAERKDDYKDADYAKIEIPTKVSLTSTETTPINLCVPEEYYVDTLQVHDGKVLIKLQAYASNIEEPYWIYMEIGIRKTERLDNGTDSSADVMANSKYDSINNKFKGYSVKKTLTGDGDSYKFVYENEEEGWYINSDGSGITCRPMRHAMKYFEQNGYTINLDLISFNDSREDGASKFSYSYILKDEEIEYNILDSVFIEVQ